MKKKNRQWYEDNKDLILDMYYSGKRVIEISEELKCNYSTLYIRFNEWNIQRREKIERSKRYNAIYNIDIHYFDNIDCEHKAYWLGFMISDGFVNDKEISFCLKKDDIKMIEQFKSDLNSSHPIAFNKDGNPHLTICSTDLCKSLQKYGLHNRKSWYFDISIALKQIPSIYENHFIRGLFDGDGSIRYYHYDYLNKPQFHFGYTGVKNVCEYLKGKFDIQRKLVYEGNTTYTLVSRDLNKINEIYKYLYKDATIYLDRKYKTFNEIQMMTFNDYNKAIS